MARREKATRARDFVLFDILYEDGSRSSHRKVPSAASGGIDDDGPAKAYIEAEDRRIAEVSGKPRGPIKSALRSTSR
jgi:hypothetical protein